MFAITVHQPWAHFLATGEKPVENRTWHPPKVLLGQWMAIHASKTYDLEGALGIRNELALDVPEPSELPHGAIIAVGILDYVARSEHEAHYNEWYCGPFGWFFRDMVKLETPVPCRGAQKLWRLLVPELVAVREAYRIARKLPPRAVSPLPGPVADARPENGAPKN